MTEEGENYRERIHHQVRYSKCNLDLATGSLASNSQDQYGVAQIDQKETHLPPVCA